MKRAALLGMAILLAASIAGATDPVVVYAAGSLRAALTDIGGEFQAQSGIPVQFEFGASGLLEDRIMAGAPAQVFASANTEHPRALAQAARWKKQWCSRATSYVRCSGRRYRPRPLNC